MYYMGYKYHMELSIWILLVKILFTTWAATSRSLMLHMNSFIWNIILCMHCRVWYSGMGGEGMVILRLNAKERERGGENSQ